MTALNVGIELPTDIITESNGIVGKKGSGKTTAGVDLVEEIHAAGVPFVVIDPKGDWYGIRASRVAKQPGISVPVFGGLHGDIQLEPTAGLYLADLIRSRNLSAVLDVSEFSNAERARFLTAFADRLYRFDSKQPLHLVLEEAHEYIPQFVGKDDAKMVGVFERLVKLGRWKGLGITMMTQRSASLNKNVLTQIDNLFMMRTTSPQDRAAVKAWIDVHADSAEILATLPSLQTGEAWLWQPTRGEPTRFRFRERWTYDAGATPKIGEKPRPPATLADVDLDQIRSAMSETIEKAKADDPVALRARVRELEGELAKRPTEKVTERVVEVQEVSVLTEDDRRLIDRVLVTVGDAVTAMDNAVKALGPKLLTTSSAAPARAHLKVESPRRPAERPAPVVTPTEGSIELRAGARRMVESLGRMHPLRLTKAQWGTVSGMKTTSGTWSTYFGELRRLGYIDQNAVGFTLTPAGFDYLGGQPAPMTAAELQDHYRSILRAGARRMLDAIMDVHPGVIDKESLGEQVEMATTSGTFSTYVGELVRNGLVDKVDGGYRATDILMHGAAA